jgi:hypothetical protein
VTFFCSDQSLLQREAIKYDPRIVQLLREMWSTTDQDSNGKIDHDEYILMSMKLYRVFVGQADAADSRAQAELDWVRDCFGNEFMNRTLFYQAWYQLADLWTEEIDANE